MVKTMLAVVLFVAACFSCAEAKCIPASQYTCREEQNGLLEHYQLTGPTPAWYVTLIQRLWPSEKPFEKSVALLVGIGKYKYQPRLDFVHNDIDDMRKFLLLEEHFENVYVYEDTDFSSRTSALAKTKDPDSITPASLSELMMNFFSSDKIVGPADRFLFYYSGHGADFGAGVGFFIFPNYKGPDFESANTLPVASIQQWSHRLHAKHALFLLDGCATGLGIVDKSVPVPGSLSVIRLSGNGSRIAFTATKGSETTYGAGDHSYFTQQFLDAVRSGEADPNRVGAMTIEAIASVMEPKLAMQPIPTGAPWYNVVPISLDRTRTGTFMFLDPHAATLQPAKTNPPENWDRFSSKSPSGENKENASQSPQVSARLTLQGSFRAPFLQSLPDVRVPQKPRSAVFISASATIDESGNIQNAHFHSTDVTPWQRSAAESLPGWKFTPAMLNGKPVPVETTIVFKFTSGKASQPRLKLAESYFAVGPKGSGNWTYHLEYRLDVASIEPGERVVMFSLPSFDVFSNEHGKLEYRFANGTVCEQEPDYQSRMDGNVSYARLMSLSFSWDETLDEQKKRALLYQLTPEDLNAGFFDTCLSYATGSIPKSKFDAQFKNYAALKSFTSPSSSKQ